MADKEVRLDAEGVEHASKLNGNVAGTNQGNLLGQLVNVKEAVAVDAELGAWNLRGRAGLAANRDEDLLGLDVHLGAIVERHLNLVLVEKLGPAVQVFDRVLVEVALVDAIEALDVGITLGLEGRPVEGSRLLYGETVCLGVVDGLGEGGSVEGNLFGDASASNSLALCISWQDCDPGNSPNVYTCSSQPLVLDNHGLCAESAGGGAGRTQTTAAAADDQVVGLLGDGSHCSQERRIAEVSRYKGYACRGYSFAQSLWTLSREEGEGVHGVGSEG